VVEIRNLYLGPAKGLYEPKRFNYFALMDIPRRLIGIGSPSECNPERGSGEGDSSSANPEDGITYHYPKAGIGLSYRLFMTNNRCIVNLMGTRTREMDEIIEFIFEMENES